MRAAPYGDCLHAHPILRAQRAGVALHDPARAPATGKQRALDLVDDRADELLRVVRLAGDGAHVGERDETVAFLARDRREEQESGERQVGQRTPRGDEPLDVLQIGARERRAREREIVERAHGVAPGKRWLLIAARPSTSPMSSENVGTRATTSGTRASSARSSASRIATTEKLRSASPIVRSTRAVRAGSARAASPRSARAAASGAASSMHTVAAAAPAGAGNETGSVFLSPRAPGW